MIIQIFVKISKGSRNKYEYDEQRQFPKLEKILGKESPWNYGIVEGAHSVGGMGCLVLSTESVLPCSIINAKPIGSLTFEFEEITDNEIIAVPKNTKTENISELSKQKMNAISDFLKYLKWVETGKRAKLKSVNDKEKTEKIILQAMELYKRVQE